LYTFGGFNDCFEPPEYEMIRSLDHLRPQSGWRVLSINTMRTACGINYGLLNLNLDHISTSLLVFGGVGNNGHMEECMLLQDYGKENPNTYKPL
jgi:hypothetical protein